MKFTFRLAIVALLSFSILFFAPTSARAANNKTGLTISPLTFELSANPGDSLKRSIRVDNISDKAVNVSVDRRNFAPLGEEGQPALTEEETPFSLASWINVTPEQAAIPAGGSHTFNFTIATPSNAEPGGHFGSIVFKTSISSAQAGGVAVGEEVGSLILLKLAGNVREQAYIESFKTAQGFLEQGPVAFESRIKNAGNVHVKPTATITITDSFGRKVTSLQVESRNILPASIRKFNSSWEQKDLFGRYTATLSVTYGDKKQILTSTATFFVIPYKIIMVVLIILGVIGFFIYRGRRRISRSLKVLFGKEQ